MCTCRSSLHLQVLSLNARKQDHSTAFRLIKDETSSVKVLCKSTFQMSYVIVCAHKASAALALCKGLDGNVAIMGLFQRYLLCELLCYVVTIGNLKNVMIHRHRLTSMSLIISSNTYRIEQYLLLWQYSTTVGYAKSGAILKRCPVCWGCYTHLFAYSLGLLWDHVSLTVRQYGPNTC